MSGIAVGEDAVNLYYYMKAKSVVRTAELSCLQLQRLQVDMLCLLQYRWAIWKLNDAGNEVWISLLSRHILECCNLTACYRSEQCIVGCDSRCGFQGLSTE